MADYDQIMKALRNAHAAGDTAAAQRLAQMARAAQQTSQPPRQAAGTPTEGYNPPERTIGQTIYENVIGSGAVDTPGERLGELIGGLGAGVSRGTMELVGLPGTVGGLMDVGAQRLGLLPEDMPPSPVFSALSGAGLREAAGAATGGATEYRAPGTAGDYAATIGEFLPSAMGGGVGTALRFGVAPAIGSETAGQAAEAAGLGETGQAIARGVGAIGTSLLAARPGAFAGDDEAARMANVMRDAGVDVSAGQARGSQALMRMEGRLAATDQQLEDFTSATMQMLGSNAKVATPTNLVAVERSIVQQMDDAVRGVNIIPNATQAQAAVDVAANYVARVPAGQLTPRVRGIANEIRALAAAGKDVPLSRLKTWRSDIGALTISPDAATREAAHALRSILDDMTDTALTAAGRSGDIASLAQAREAYRNYIGVRDAASRAGAEGGILSPTALNQSMIRAQGREAYATGRATPMTDFTRSGAATLRSAPTVLPGGQRTITEALPLALASMAGAGSYGAGLGPLGIGLAAAGGALAPAVGQMAMRSAPVQAMLRDPLRTMTQAGRTIPGLLAQ
jgi:hypothetical protein